MTKCTKCYYNTDEHEDDATICACHRDFREEFFPDVNSPYCTTCTEAVIKTYFSSNYKYIYVEFPTQVFSPSFEGKYYMI